MMLLASRVHVVYSALQLGTLSYKYLRFVMSDRRIPPGLYITVVGLPLHPHERWQRHPHQWQRQQQEYRGWLRRLCLQAGR